MSFIKNLRGVKMLAISEISKRTEIEDKLQRFGMHFVFNDENSVCVDGNMSIEEFIEIAEMLKHGAAHAKTKNMRIGDVHIGGELNPQFR